MRKNKPLFYVVSILVLIFITWYFMIKKYDYQVYFTAKASPGIVYNNIRAIKRWDSSNKSDDVIIINKKPFSDVQQLINLPDSTFIFNWKITAINDSISKINVGIKDVNNSIKTRLSLLFHKPKFIIKSIEKIEGFRKELNNRLQLFKVSIKGLDTLPGYSNAIYIPLKSKMRDKASEMFKKIIFLTMYMKEHQIKRVGDPFIEVTKWDIKNDSIYFNFGFPVEHRDVYPADSIIKIKSIKSKKALKAVFNGNYRISDRAWFVLYDYAQRHNINIEKRPFEIFLNDPHNGGSPIDWQAAVYLPIK